MNDVELIAIMPVFNEEAGIARVITGWLEALSRERITYLLVAINDGSTDASLAILNQLQLRFPTQLIVLTKINSGHGQTCRFGYEFAVSHGAQWVLQIDSDGQCDPAFLAEFMAKRYQADCIFGVRVSRDDGFSRRFISTVCRLLIAIFTGQRLRDPNVPYRLIECSALAAALRTVPKEIDLQNIALAVALKRNGERRWAYVPIRFRAPIHAQVRMTLPKIVRMGFRMLAQIHNVKNVS